MLIRDFGVRVTIPSNLTPFLRLGKQLLLGVGTDLDRSDLVEATIDELLGAQRTTRPQPADDRLDARQRGIADLFRDEIDARHQGAAVDPLFPGVPTFDGRWIEQILAHIGRLHRQLANAWLRELVAADEP